VWWILNVSTTCSTFLPAALLSVNFQSHIFYPLLCCPSFSCLAFSSPALLSVIFQSCIFQPCTFVRHFPVLQIQRPQGWTLRSKEEKIHRSFWNVLLQKALKNSVDTTQDEWMDSVQIKSWQRTSGPCEVNHWNWDFMAIRHGNMKVWRRKWFKDVYQATELVEDNAGVGQMTSPNGLGWRSMKRQQQRKIVIVGERRAANPSDGGRHWTTTTFSVIAYPITYRPLFRQPLFRQYYHFTGYTMLFRISDSRQDVGWLTAVE